ncbi:hypothetical protein A1D23_08380 [Chelonobacter oris]|uniref:TIGR03749 family integrating conjugative element protein n=1 Tax=Chelonobacter oris TaxID=505317 RepID=UPI00244B4E94|nr:TIGR03749 family integrating conjugative element protein [Chelonobacter oris]MDH3000197.1 hypothetical protein [Chelonobacter oris]
MKRLSLLTALSLSLSAGLVSQSVSADILMKWERKPIPIALKPEQERIVFVDKNVKVGYPAELDGKLRIQSTGGAVYFKALTAFPTTRLQLRDVTNGELILLDVSANTGVSNPQEPIRFVYDSPIEKQSAPFNQDDSTLAQLGLDEITDNAVSIKPQLPIPVSGYGRPEDTTTLYLVTEGYADRAVIPEAKRDKPRRKVKKVTVTKTTPLNATSSQATASREAAHESE